MPTVPLSIDRWQGGIAPSLKEGLRGGAAYVRNLDIHEDPSLIQLLPGTSKDSGSTVTDLVIDMCRVPNGDTYFLGEDKKLYKRTAAGTWSLEDTVSGDTNGMGMVYWPQKDTIYITTDTSISTYGRVSSSPTLTDNKFTTFVDKKIDIPANAVYPTPATMQGWWKLDEESGSRSDSSGNANTLSSNSVGSSTNAQEGSRSASFERDSTSHLSITNGDQTGLNTTSDFTIAGWVNLESANIQQTIAGKWEESSDRRQYRVYINSSNKLVFEVSSDGTAGNITSVTGSTTITSLGLTDWHYFGAVYTAGSRMEIFHGTTPGTLSSDGSNTSSIPASVNSGSGSFAIGAHTLSSAQDAFDGLIDDIIIWNTALTESDLEDASNASAGTYSVSDSISEASTDKFEFTPSWDPHINVVIPIEDEGTGDWTVTLHDDADNVVASKTIANASLTASADNTFTFDNQVRITLGATYHYHITSTVADGTMTASSEAIDTTADRLVDVKSNAHPVVEFLDFIAIGNGQHLMTYDGNLEEATDSDGTETSSWEKRFSLPSGYEITCLAYYDEYLVAGAEYRGDNVEDFAKGLLVFWDGTSDSINSFIQVEEGGVQNILPTDNILYFIAGLRGELFAFGSENYSKIKRWPSTSYAKYARSYHSASTVYQGMPLFGAFFKTDSADIPQGVYAFGSRETVYDPAFTHDYTVSSGSIKKSSLRIGAVSDFGTDLFIAWDDNGTFGVDIVEPSNNPASTGVYESLIFDDAPNVWREKSLHGLKLYHEALPAGAEVLLSYKVDRGSWVDGTANTTDGDTVTIFSTGKVRFREIQFRIQLTATATNFSVYNLVADVDLNRPQARILKHA